MSHFINFNYLMVLYYNVTSQPISLFSDCIVVSAFYPLCVCKDTDKSTWGYQHIQYGVVYKKARTERKGNVKGHLLYEYFFNFIKNLKQNANIC